MDSCSPIRTSLRIVDISAHWGRDRDSAGLPLSIVKGRIHARQEYSCKDESTLEVDLLVDLNMRREYEAIGCERRRWSGRIVETL